MTITTRKYFGTDGIRGPVGGSSINPEFVLKLGWAVGSMFAPGEHKKVLIAKDPRISGYLLESALEAGLSSAGVTTDLLGPMPTPALAYLTRTLRAQAGIMISASHNLYHDNGIKFFDHDGMKLPDELELAIEKKIAEPLVMVPSEQLGKAVRVDDAPGRYIEFCKSTIPPKTSFNGLKVVIDCANGATYHIAPNVFRELGANVIAINIAPNGFNINADCGSTAPETLVHAVKEHQADLGIAFDGDGDRLIMVDAAGKIFNGDELLYLVAKDRATRQVINGGVVGTVMTNLGIEIALRDLKLPFARTKVGDRYILEKLMNERWELGGEQSGHIICLDKNTTGDGIVASLQILEFMQREGKSLSELAHGVTLFPQVLVNVETSNAAQVMNEIKVQQAVKKVNDKLNERGRIVIRPSGTEPKVRIMLEGEDKTEITLLAEEVAEVIRQGVGK